MVDNNTEFVRWFFMGWRNMTVIMVCYGSDHYIGGRHRDEHTDWVITNPIMLKIFCLEKVAVIKSC